MTEVAEVPALDAESEAAPEQETAEPETESGDSAAAEKVNAGASESGKNIAKALKPRGPSISGSGNGKTRAQRDAEGIEDHHRALTRAFAKNMSGWSHSPSNKS